MKNREIVENFARRDEFGKKLMAMQEELRNLRDAARDLELLVQRLQEADEIYKGVAIRNVDEVYNHRRFLDIRAVGDDVTRYGEAYDAIGARSGHIGINLRDWGHYDAGGRLHWTDDWDEAIFVLKEWVACDKSPGLKP